MLGAPSSPTSWDQTLTNLFSRHMSCQCARSALIYTPRRLRSVEHVIEPWLSLLPGTRQLLPSYHTSLRSCLVPTPFDGALEDRYSHYWRHDETRSHGVRLDILRHRQGTWHLCEAADRERSLKGHRRDSGTIQDLSIRRCRHAGQILLGVFAERSIWGGGCCSTLASTTYIHFTAFGRAVCSFCCLGRRRGAAPQHTRCC